MPSIQIRQEIIGPQSELYAITEFLGRGAFGEVYRAVGRSTGAVIAVKMLALGELADDVDKRALLNEIKAARQVNHRNVVRVLHVDEGTNPSVGPYACMEYISGGTLERHLRVHRQASAQIPISRALVMMLDIAQGARAINEKLVHRDIKPDNILIEGETLMIGDFGIAKFVEESTRRQTFKGGQAVAYMAPEGWVGEKNTYKLDVYAVGIVFDEILTLTHPFRSRVVDQGSSRDWERVHLHEIFPDLRPLRNDAPLGLVQLVPRMAAKRPQERPEWSEILERLSDPANEPAASVSPAISQAVTAAVGAVVAKKAAEEKVRLKLAAEQRESERRLELFKYSCDALLQRFQPAVEHFNRECQVDQIRVKKGREAFGRVGGLTYVLGWGVSLMCFRRARKSCWSSTTWRGLGHEYAGAL